MKISPIITKFVVYEEAAREGWKSEFQKVEEWQKSGFVSVGSQLPERQQCLCFVSGNKKKLPPTGFSDSGIFFSLHSVEGWQSSKNLFADIFIDSGLLIRYRYHVLCCAPFLSFSFSLWFLFKPPFILPIMFPKIRGS